MNYERKNIQPKEVRLVESKIIIPNIYSLEKIGAGHDGVVYRYGDLALKLLKYDIAKRKEKKLMSFDKATYFTENLILKKIEGPIDTMLDVDGVYTGYVMKYIENLASEKLKGTKEYKDPSEYRLIDLIFSVADLESDFSELSKKNVCAKDINRGSYIYSNDFLHLCDTDKYIRCSSSSVSDLNRSAINFVFAKMMYYMMLNLKNYDKVSRKILLEWVKKVCNDPRFIYNLNLECGHDLDQPIKEYVKYKVKQIIH